MASYNKILLLGNVTRDPEIKYLPSGTAVMEVGLAINDQRKGQNGEWIKETTFIDCTLFGRTAEVACEYATKGTPIFIEGHLKLDQWQAQDGSKRSKLKVVGERMQLLGSKGSSPTSPNEYYQASPPGEGIDEPKMRPGDENPF